MPERLLLPPFPKQQLLLPGRCAWRCQGQRLPRPLPRGRRPRRKAPGRRRPCWQHPITQSGNLLPQLVLLQLLARCLDLLPQVQVPGLRLLQLAHTSLCQRCTLPGLRQLAHAGLRQCRLLAGLCLSALLLRLGRAALRGSLLRSPLRLLRVGPADGVQHLRELCTPAAWPGPAVGLRRLGALRHVVRQQRLEGAARTWCPSGPWCL
mmetsp:Transcript_12210/g.34634  ORF Transcript_12210/g.34634 Transcript_12210/m.34634 type:complete len:207 (-) Transcript_12210:739-1359(-)